jgi:hypothetical protein
VRSDCLPIAENLTGAPEPEANPTDRPIASDGAVALVASRGRPSVATEGTSLDSSGAGTVTLGERSAGEATAGGDRMSCRDVVMGRGRPSDLWEGAGGRHGAGRWGLPLLYPG